MSFRLKTILGIAFIEVVLLTILVLSGLNYLRQTSEAELLSRGTTTAQLFATMTADSVLSVDLATLDALVESTIKNDGISYVRVRNNDGMILSESGDLEALNAPFSEDESIEDASLDARLDVSSSIIVSGEIFGRVEIGLSTDRLQVTLGKAQRWMLTIAATEILVVAVFGIGLGTILTSQLAKLRAAARRVSAGEFGYQLNVRGKDELADTTRSFNKMSAALAEFAREAEDARKRAEDGRDYAETLLNDAMNSMPQSVLIVDSNERVAFANDRFLTNQPHGAIANIHDETFSSITERIGDVACRETGEPISASDRIERLRQVENYPSWRSLTPKSQTTLTTQQRMSNGGVVVVEHDVTELFEALERNRQLEMELMQTQKLESLGTLAGGIAHEINTPVQFVGDNLKFADESFQSVIPIVQALADHTDPSTDDLRAKLDDVNWAFISEELAEAIIESRAGISAVGDIVKSVKEFAHPDSDTKTNQDIESIISNTLTVSRNQWRHHAEVKLAIGDGLNAVPCFAGKLSQVLINLVINAADALHENAVSNGIIYISAHRSKEHATIVVKDNGPGVPEELRGKIFDLFFTTKAPGSGTGQGLAICKRIIESNHGGKLTLLPSDGQGAAFEIVLPIEENACAA